MRKESHYKELENKTQATFFKYSLIAIGLPLVYIGLAELFYGLNFLYSAYSVVGLGVLLIVIAFNFQKLSISLEKIAIAIIIFTIPYLTFRILTTNGFHSSNVIWYIVIYLYAHLFVGEKFLRLTFFYSLIFIALNLILEFQFHDYFNAFQQSYTLFLSLQLSFLNLAIVAFHLYLYHKLDMQLRKQINFQEEIIQSNSKLALAGEVSGNIAHEVNTPLGTMQLALEKLKLSTKKRGDEEVYQKDLSLLLMMTKKIDNIIKNTLKLYYNPEQIRTQDIKLGELLSETQEIVAGKMERHKVNFSIDYHNLDHIFLHCSPQEIEQVLVNLISNSVDAIKDNKEKWIQLNVYDERKKHVAIEVVDSGKGIANNTRKRMFEPYFTTKESGEGSGIGLSLSADLIAKNKGKLNYLQKRENTTFSLTIPMAE